MNGIFIDLKYLEQYLHILQIKDHIISSNIANAETPFYKKLKLEISFNHDIPLKVTKRKHIQNNLSPFSYRIKTVQNSLLGSDRNNVDLQQELMSLEKVSLTYKTILKFVKNTFSTLELVIKSGG